VEGVPATGGGWERNSAAQRALVLNGDKLRHWAIRVKAEALLHWRRIGLNYHWPERVTWRQRKTREGLFKEK